MTTTPRKINQPLEVWQDNERPDFLFQVLAHLPPDELGPLALVASSSPLELNEGEEMYLDTLRSTAHLVWTEEDGPLPAEFVFEEE